MQFGRDTDTDNGIRNNPQQQPTSSSWHCWLLPVLVALIVLGCLGASASMQPSLSGGRLTIEPLEPPQSLFTWSAAPAEHPAEHPAEKPFGRSVSRNISPATLLSQAHSCKQPPLSRCEKELYETEWIGNILVWKEPGAALCQLAYTSTKEANRILGNETRVLVMGDSLSRRFGETLSVLLKAHNDGVDVKTLNYDLYTHDTLTHLNGRIVSMWCPLVRDLGAALDSPELLSKFDVFVLSVGAHESLSKNTGSETMEGLFKVIKTVEKLVWLWRGRKTFVWQAEPWGRESTRTAMHQNINDIMRCFWPGLFLDNWKLMHGRDSGMNRINGNTDYHFGWEGRIALVESFLNFMRIREGKDRGQHNQ